MKKQNEASFTTSLRGKIMIAALAGIVALGAAWYISRFAFGQMLQTVEELSEPNEKLQMVNAIFHGIVNMDRFEEIENFPTSESESLEILSETDRIQISLDSLAILCADNERQTSLIDSVRHLLEQREEVMFRFLEERKKLAQNNYVNEELKLLQEIVDNPMTDSLVLTKAHKIITRIEKSADTVVVQTESSSALMDFLRGIVGKNKKSETLEITKEDEIVEEELNTQIDTLVFTRRDSVLTVAQNLIGSISASQKKKRESYFAREEELAAIERSFVAQVVAILSTVEQEVIRQNTDNTASAQKVVTESVRNISIVLLAFFVVTFILVLLILIDISRSARYRLQLVNAKEEAEYHSAARQRFLSNMSHEIRTPLQSIIGYAEQLQQAERPDKEDINSIYSSSSHLLQIVNEVLDFNRINSGKFTFEENPFNLQELLKEVTFNLKPQVRAKGIELILEDQSGLKTDLIGDAFRLKQILFNLLGNAIKFTESGHVKLKVRSVKKGLGSQIIFTVEDTGIGIEKDKIGAIFSQFEQADASISRTFGGSGLGLSIVKSLVESRDGSINVQSTPGKGSVFQVTLTYAHVETNLLQNNVKSIDPGSFNGTVWLVDDDKLIARLCSTILSKYNVEHRVFHTAEDLLFIPWDSQVKLVLTDIRLPGIGGRELCAALRKKHGASLRIAAMTAEAVPEEREAILKSGFNQILHKPFNQSDLLNLILEFAAEGALSESAEKPESTGKDHPDFRNLKKMTMEDPDLMRSILALFIQDSLEDLEKIFLAVSIADSDAASDLFHRLAGRIAQIGDTDLAAKFRKFEIDIRNGRKVGDMEKQIKSASILLEKLVIQVKDEMLRLEKETSE